VLLCYDRSSLACKLRAQADNVESALCRRISETQAQKSRLEHQLKLVSSPSTAPPKFKVNKSCSVMKKKLQSEGGGGRRSGGGESR